MMRIPFDNTYVGLPERFYSRVAPRPVAAPGLVRVNAPLAAYLGLDAELLGSEEGALLIAGNRVPEGAEPIAVAYAGHQFGHFNPQLGDGRAVLLGEVIARDGRRYDLQLKGSGMTPFSRGGDGRSPLGSVLREYVVSEAMYALGIPTTRALAAATTGEHVYRTNAVPGGVLLRVARSHIRVGTFEYFAARRDIEALRLLVDHVVARHYPECAQDKRPAVALLHAVAARQAELVASWQLLGFIHGVMNTDNMLVSGETIDYGPCAFMDNYDPATVYSSIDHHGRYAFQNQPVIARWNLACLARALLPLLGAEDDGGLARAQAIVDAFPEAHDRAFQRGLGRKLGLSTEEPEDRVLVADLLQAMAASEADFTLTFRSLADQADPDGRARAPETTVAEVFQAPQALRGWLERWQARLARDPRDPHVRAADMRAVNPALIPRNHLVEAAIRAAEGAGDFAPFHALVDALAKPYDYHTGLAVFARPPRADERVLQTFCGT